VFIVLIGGALLLGHGYTQNNKDFGWYMIFLIGTLAIGCANVLCENALQHVYVYSDISEAEKMDEENGNQNVNTGSLHSQKGPKVYLISYLQLYFAANLWALLFTLAFFLVPLIAYNTNFHDYTVDGLACIFSFGESNTCNLHHDDHTGCNRNQKTLAMICIWLSSTFSFICMIAACYLERVEGAVYATLGYTLATAVATVCFMSKQLLTYRYYTSVNYLEITSMIITFVGVFLYKMTVITDRFKPKHFKEFINEDWWDFRYDKKQKKIRLNLKEIDQY